MDEHLKFIGWVPSPPSNIQASVFSEEKGELHALTRKALSWDDYQSAVTVKVDRLLFLNDSLGKGIREATFVSYQIPP